jgi:outer membrane protein assembly factor BamC
LGVEVEHLNRERGVYEVTYPLVGEAKRDMVDRLTFWNNDEQPMVDVKLVLENLGEPTTQVRAYRGNDPDSSETATALLEALHRQLSPDSAATAAATQPVVSARQYTAQQARAEQAVTTQQSRYRLEQQGGTGRILTDQEFPRSWREVGMAIAAESLKVEDRDRSRGLYFVVDAAGPGEGKGLLAKMKFWGDDDPATVTRLIAVQPVEGGGNQVLVFDEDEKLDSSPAATELLNRLYKHLR